MATHLEKEITDLVKRADKNPDKTGPQRRDALRRLIDLTHSENPNLKVYAAANIRNYFNDFPELEDAAIDAIYDLCEDQAPLVRTAGYNAILQVSRDSRKWVKRNADVLVQLLQSDEPDEVEFVKKALNEHLDLDPQVTIGVLCDQLTPFDDAVDEEEKTIRERLRALVISFLTGRAKRAIVDRHVHKPGSEEALVNGLFLAISTSRDDTQTVTIVDDLLLALPGFKPSSPRIHELLKVLLTKARTILKDELRSGESASLDRTRFHLEMAADVVTVRRLTSAVDLLQFYCGHLLGKIVLQKLSADAQLFVVLNVAETLATCAQGQMSPSDHLAICRKQIVDAAPMLLQVLTDAKLPNARSWEASKVILNACTERKKESAWTVPQNLTSQLKILQGLAQVGKEAHQDLKDILTALMQPTVKPTPSTPHNVVNVSQGVPSRSAPSVKPPSGNGSTTMPGRRINIPGKQRVVHQETKMPAEPKTGPLPAPNAPPPPSPALVSEKRDSAPRKRSPTSHEAPVSPKRAKKASSPPSLLSRMTGPASEQPSVGVAVNATGRAQPPPSAGANISRGGFSIKGAAQAEKNSLQTNPLTTRSASLLDRIAKGERRKFA